MSGYDDRAILQITLITAWFNYINRVADGLGVAGSSFSPTAPENSGSRAEIVPVADGLF